MIISHKLKVIHIRLKKVAGSSFEMALARYCGADDILTPIKGGKKSNYHRARNYEAFKIKSRIGHLGA
ncbi:MAG: hypothetical protein F4Y58_00425, partial [Gammaproteobacteria bacterium]|nr:hypothetical protein [Gammaproteobacteria bacterium]